jgi:DNA-binding NarL/FixJ family response regulator
MLEALHRFPSSNLMSSELHWQPLNWMESMTKELSVRETQILRLIAEGKENREIAQVLGISVRTVEAHRARIMLKLDLESVTGLVRYAVRNGIIEA